MLGSKPRVFWAILISVHALVGAVVLVPLSIKTMVSAVKVWTWGNISAVVYGVTMTLVCELVLILVAVFTIRDAIQERKRRSL